MPQRVLALSPLCFPLYTRFNSSSPGVPAAARVCVRASVSNCVCWRVSQSLTLSRSMSVSPSLAPYVFAFSFLLLPIPKHTKHSQVQPFSLPNPLLKTPQQLPKSAKPGSSCTIITSKQNMLCSVRTIYTSTLRASFLSFCFQGTSFCDSCVCVGAGGVNGWWLAREVWFSRWYTGPQLPLPVTNYPKTPTPVKRIISWPKHWK